ncbi:phage holin [Terribacillus sp. AE2B 122]|uniref:phage holin n=1 Tax=Terribacillus sp. AE2B 122 TaxID=1331902 RepID=UPI0015830BA5|nr:phage holin [Terribacillus sp. AE2B 122]
MDRGTFVRTLVLFIALTNQLLTIFNKSPLPIKSEDWEQFVSLLFTFATSIWAWYRNNYITAKGKEQKRILEKEKLIK